MFLYYMQNHSKYFENYDGYRLHILKCIFVVKCLGIKCYKSNLCCYRKAKNSKSQREKMA